MSRELALNASGEFPEALAFWLLFANRIPSEGVGAANVAICFDSKMTAYVLPPTDGLDDELPTMAARSWQRPSGTAELPPNIKEILQWAISQTELPIGNVLVLGDACQAVQQIVVKVCSENSIPCQLIDNGHMQGVRAMTSATLGAMFVDQMPGNVPSISGGSAQRILGRVTPGKPVAWRNLLIDMNDGDSPIMKLRDAI
ncbi:MAG: hypothetical protein R3C03_16145 [Pirellulaceae bacterium]